MLHLQNKMNVKRFLRAGTESSVARFTEGKALHMFNDSNLDMDIVNAFNLVVGPLIEEFKQDKSEQTKIYTKSHTFQITDKMYKELIRNKSSENFYFKYSVFFNMFSGLGKIIDKYEDVYTQGVSDTHKFNIEINARLEGSYWYRFVCYQVSNTDKIVTLFAELHRLTLDGYCVCCRL